MDINISDEELTLLAYLHEHATGYTPADMLTRTEMQELLTELEMTPDVFRRRATYLASFGLVGVSEITFVNSLGGGAEIKGVGITGPGENYMRQLEVEAEKVEPGKFKKIGANTIQASGKIITPVAIKLLTDFVSSHVGELAQVVGKLWH